MSLVYESVKVWQIRCVTRDGLVSFPRWIPVYYSVIYYSVIMYSCLLQCNLPLFVYYESMKRKLLPLRVGFLGQSYFVYATLLLCWIEPGDPSFSFGLPWNHPLRQSPKKMFVLKSRDPMCVVRTFVRIQGWVVSIYQKRPEIGEGGSEEEVRRKFRGTQRDNSTFLQCQSEEGEKGL